MRALQENRILSVQQNASGSDFGTIGFHEGKNLSYFVFPKALPQARNTHVIGIKYDLLDEGEPVGKGTATPVKRKEPKPRPPALKVFAVTVRSVATIETALEIKALNPDAAKESALK
ncbi:MAG: hypothetical protein JWM68_1378, partial [Verrucomicrobiales bacterium]|nr:hypothetical protein [Verrucomicrobiales bacterium]